MAFMPSASVLVAVDVGNSRIKLGRFACAAGSQGIGRHGTLTPGSSPKRRGEILPRPTAMLELPLAPVGEVDAGQLAAWCQAQVGDRATWLVASVYRGAADRLEAAAARLAAAAEADWQVRRLTRYDVPMRLDVDQPDQLGIDRLLGALAADRIRAPGQAAIVVDVGSAITVDLVTPDGVYAGGAILPGLALSARALDEYTDALPLVPVDEITQPKAVGKSTVGAIESGLFWGAVGAVRELIDRLSAGLAEPPAVIVSGGASKPIADAMVGGTGQPVRHLPHLVLAGIALVGQAGG